MNCAKYRKRLYLYRTGELSERKKKKLLEHLSRCEVCAHLAFEINRMETALSKVRGPVVSENDPGLIRAVLEAAGEPGTSVRRAGARRPGASGPGSPFRAFGPVPAFVMAMFLLFLVQESWVQLRVSRLEERIGSSPASGPGLIFSDLSFRSERKPAGFYPGSGPVDIPDLRLPGSVREPFGPLLSGPGTGEAVLVDRESLIRFLESYERLIRVNRSCEAIFKRLESVAGKVKMEDGLGSREIRELIRNRQRILLEIQKIVSL